jgi:hypothetical protein
MYLKLKKEDKYNKDNKDNKDYNKHYNKDNVETRGTNQSKVYTNYTQVLTELDKKINEIKNLTKDFRYIVITYGTDFFSENNKDDLLILQKYTVFPKINSNYNLRNQVFFSGKDSLLDGSYPDVIYFRPKINFLQTIAAFTNTVENKEFHQGYIGYTANDKFNIKTGYDSSINIQDELNKLHSELDEINLVEKKFTFKYNVDKEFYFINDSKIAMNGKAVTDVINLVKQSPYVIQPDTSAKQRSLVTGDQQQIIIHVNILRNSIKSYIHKIASNYNFQHMDYLFKKTINITQGDSSESAFYSFSTLVDNFNYQLAKQNLTFEAELKILGEPAYTFSSSAAPAIYIEVNNRDGTKNNFLSGSYRITKLKHEIDTQGSYTTTLTLNYITSGDIADGITNTASDIVKEDVT